MTSSVDMLTRAGWSPVLVRKQYDPRGEQLPTWSVYVWRRDQRIELGRYTTEHAAFTAAQDIERRMHRTAGASEGDALDAAEGGARRIDPAEARARSQASAARREDPRPKKHTPAAPTVLLTLGDAPGSLTTEGAARVMLDVLDECRHPQHRRLRDRLTLVCVLGTSQFDSLDEILDDLTAAVRDVTADGWSFVAGAFEAHEGTWLGWIPEPRA